MGVGTLREGPLHAAIKDWCTHPGDRQEVPVDGYVVDVVREGLLIEVQTGSFSSIRHKLADLLVQHKVRLVHPVAREKWIVKVDAGGVELSRRKSPRRGSLVEAFADLVYLVPVLGHPNLTVRLLHTQEDEVRRRGRGGRQSRRGGGWVVAERRLVGVASVHDYRAATDWLDLVPEDAGDTFTTAALASAIGRPRRLAQKLAYTLRELGALEPVGKSGNAVVYRRAPLSPTPGSPPGAATPLQ